MSDTPRSETDDGLAALAVLQGLDPQGSLLEPVQALVRSMPPMRRKAMALALAAVARSKDKPHSWLAHALENGYALEEAERALADRVVVEGVGLEVASKKELGALLASLYERRHGEAPPPKALDHQGGLPLAKLASLDGELYGWVKRETDRWAMRRVSFVEKDGVRYECAPPQTPELMVEAIENGLKARGL